jgi:molybdopterin-binding protein
MVPFGPFIRVSIDFGSPLTALVTRRSADELSLAVGMPVIAGIKATAIHVLADTG